MPSGVKLPTGAVNCCASVGHSTSGGFVLGTGGAAGAFGASGGAVGATGGGGGAS